MLDPMDLVGLVFLLLIVGGLFLIIQAFRAFESGGGIWGVFWFIVCFGSVVGILILLVVGIVKTIDDANKRRWKNRQRRAR